MELNLREADIAAIFDRGLQAHNAGDLSAAEQLYQETLAIKPEHPEANHNIGVVLVAKNELDKALAFFKFALDNSPNVSLFWASYIDTLIKLERIGESKKLVEAVKQAGISCDKIDVLSQHLDVKHHDPGPKESEDLNRLLEQQKFEDAIKICLSLTETYPSSAVLSVALGKCYFELGQIEPAIKSYQKATEINPGCVPAFVMLSHIHSAQGDAGHAIENLKKAIVIEPNNHELYSMIGVEFLQKRDADEAIRYLGQALRQNPNSHLALSMLGDAYNQKGLILNEQGKLDDAITTYKKVLEIKPNNIDAHNNIGVAFHNRGDLIAAIESFKQAVKIKPEFAQAYVNMGVCHSDRGNIKAAIKAYTKALYINPTHVKAGRAINTLYVQLISSSAQEKNLVKIAKELSPRHWQASPYHFIQKAIQKFLMNETTKSALALNQFKKCEAAQFEILEHTDIKFCSGYNIFLNKLMPFNSKNHIIQKSKIYHLGESHCLSYAHQTIDINNRKFTIKPKITFGAKIYHLSKPENNHFKAVTELNFKSIPKKSKVFLSFGEIDCRFDEGFIKALSKTNVVKEKLIKNTIISYVNWIAELNVNKEHQIYFFNVPAPFFNTKYSTKLNNQMADIIKFYNQSLKQTVSDIGYRLIDVYKATSDPDGFSNNCYHVDGYHLGPAIIPCIETQLNEPISILNLPL